MKPRIVLIGAIALLAVACSRQVVPDSLRTELDRTVVFKELKARPDDYRGRLVILGGEILEAKNRKDGTELEMLQLPLDSRDRPATQRVFSEGRFLLRYPEYLDTAVAHPGRRVTVVAEVIGEKVLPLDELEYHYPYLEIKFIHLWEERRPVAYGPYSEAWHPGFYPYPYFYPYAPFYYGAPYVIVVPEPDPPPTNPRRDRRPRR